MKTYESLIINDKAVEYVLADSLSNITKITNTPKYLHWITNYKEIIVDANEKLDVPVLAGYQDPYVDLSNKSKIQIHYDAIEQDDTYVEVESSNDDTCLLQDNVFIKSVFFNGTTVNIKTTMNRDAAVEYSEAEANKLLELLKVLAPNHVYSTLQPEDYFKITPNTNEFVTKTIDDKKYTGDEVWRKLGSHRNTDEYKVELFYRD